MMFARALVILICSCSIQTYPSNTSTNIHDFGSGTDGLDPYGSLCQASNGLIFGMTNAGGTHGHGGMIFSFDPTNAAGTYTDVHNFGFGTDGAVPFGSLIQANNGLLYGMTEEGGANSIGMIFSFDPTDVAGSYTDVHDFTGIPSDGEVPFGSVIQARDGRIYGMTQGGGSHFAGIIFSFDPANPAGSYMNLHDFGSIANDGANPFGSLIQASNGLIYGMVTNGGVNGIGMIFSFDPANVLGTYTNIHDFGSIANDGSNPQYGSPFQASNGLIYGMTEFGGAHNSGIIFSFDPANVAGSYMNIHDFGSSPSDGFFPHGSLIQASNGLLYGMTLAGGSDHLGMIFSLDPANPAGSFTEVHGFTGVPSDGAAPYGSLIQASSGMVYGMTEAGGANGLGIIFELNVPLPSLSSLQRAFRRSPAPQGYRSRGR